MLLRLDPFDEIPHSATLPFDCERTRAGFSAPLSCFISNRLTPEMELCPGKHLFVGTGFEEKGSQS